MHVDEFPEKLHPAFARLVNFLLEENPEAAPALQQTLACFREGVSASLVTTVQELAEDARKQEPSHKRKDTKNGFIKGPKAVSGPFTGPLKLTKPR